MENIGLISQVCLASIFLQEGTTELARCIRTEKSSSRTLFIYCGFEKPISSCNLYDYEADQSVQGFVSTEWNHQEQKYIHYCDFDFAKLGFQCEFD